MPQISILLPVFKPRHVELSESVSSLLIAAPEDCEIAIGLDGPCEGELMEKISRLKKISRSASIKLFEFPRQGLSSTLNALIDKTDSKWIARHDADDVSLPNRFKQQVEAMIDNPKASFCGMQICRCDPGLKPFAIQRKYPTSYRGQLLYSCCINNPIAHPSLFLSRDKLGDNRYKSIEGAEDWELYTRLWSKGHKSFNLTTIGILYRVHQEQITARKRSESTIKAMKKATLQAIDTSGEPGLPYRLLHYLSSTARLTEFGFAIKENKERHR